MLADMYEPGVESSPYGKDICIGDPPCKDKNKTDLLSTNSSRSGEALIRVPMARTRQSGSEAGSA